METQRILEEPNAGGNSVVSEGLAMEILYRIYDAKNIYTEMEIEYYYDNWKKCDFITTIKGENIGVSVTRILTPLMFNEDKLHMHISNLLYKKLYGLVVSRAGTLDECVFSKSILFVWSPNRVSTRIIKLLFNHCIDKSLKEDVKLIVAETNESKLRNDFSPIEKRYMFTVII